MSTKSKGSMTPAAAKKELARDKAHFVNANLTDPEKVACKAWLPDLGALDDALLKFTQEGYRVSVKFDDYSAAYAAFCTTVDPKSPNGGYILAGRGSTPLKAIKQALYAHYGKFEGDWSPHYQQSTQDEFDD